MANLPRDGQVQQIHGLMWGDPGQGLQDAAYFDGRRFVVDAAQGVQGPIIDKGGQVFNVRAYGAIGDGVHDDTAAIQAAINAAGGSAGRGTVFLPGQTATGATAVYLVTPDANGYAIYMDTYDYAALIGGWTGRSYGPIVRCSSNSFTGILSIGAHANVKRSFCRVSNLTFQANDGTLAYGTGSGIGIDIRGSGTLLDHVRVEWVGGSSFINLNTPDNSAGNRSIDNILYDVYLYGPGNDTTNGLTIQGNVTDTELVLVKASGVKRNSTGNGGQYGVFVDGTQATGVPAGIQFIACHPYFWRVWGLYMTGVSLMTILAGQYENNGAAAATGGIQILGTSLVSVANAIFYGNYAVDIIAGALGAVTDHMTIHDCLMQGTNNATFLRNIYTTYVSNSSIHNNMLMKNSASGIIDSITLATNTLRTLIFGNNYDTKITEQTGANYNRVDQNFGPASSITIVGANSAQSNNINA